VHETIRAAAVCGFILSNQSIAIVAIHGLVLSSPLPPRPAVIIGDMERADADLHIWAAHTVRICANVIG